ncbi:hypothetical protein EEB14_37520 [Rhodococcus sp. WS4]|nr:hypothetical protein EEB14_37520 [Rhodococcus sp. WS4]
MARIRLRTQTGRAGYPNGCLVLSAPARAGRRTILMSPPWTDTVGLARSLLAVGAALTLIASSPDSVFSYRLGTGPTPVCDGAKNALAFCLVPRDQVLVPYLGAIAVLLLAASGWRPRITAIPQWYVHLSLFLGMSAPDGGDQLAAILSLLLVPVSLTDDRTWHWARQPARSDGMPSRRFQWRLAIATTFLITAKIQIAVVYFQAGVAKLSHSEWADGTAFYYWSTDPAFGVPAWIAGPVRAVVESPYLVVWLAWLPMALEIVLAVGVFVAVPARKYLLAAAVTFHLSIALLMGLWSFAFTMWAAVPLLLGPVGYQLSGWVGRGDHPDRSAEPASFSGPP